MPRITKAHLQISINELNLIRAATGRLLIKLTKNIFNEFRLKILIDTDVLKIGFDKKSAAEMLNQLSDIIYWEKNQKITGNLQVYNHREYACCEYEQNDRPGYQLGEIVIKPLNPDYDTDPEQKPEVGVIIQTHDDGDFRTDMFGNASPIEVRYATLLEIKEYRPQLIHDIRN